jgi:hypothetical protein
MLHIVQLLCNHPVIVTMATLSLCFAAILSAAVYHRDKMKSFVYDEMKVTKGMSTELQVHSQSD